MTREITRTAELSECGRFRFNLTRDWDASKPRALFIMLNPSTADADKDDPTIRKCMGFCDRLGLGGFTVVNLFAFRATKPADLRAGGYVRHPDEDDWIDLALNGVDVTICAWGANARTLARPAQVLGMLRGGVGSWRRPQALHINGDGTPAHPLMLAYDVCQTREDLKVIL